MKIIYFVNVYEKYNDKADKMIFRFENADEATSFAEVARTAYSGFATIGVSVDLEAESEDK